MSLPLKSEYVTNLSIHERDVVKRLVDELGTIVGYLLGETAQINILKNPERLQRLHEIDGLVRDAKTRKAYSK